MKKTDLESMKKMNQTLVLNAIRTHQPLSRADLSRLVGLSRSTVSSIVDKLLFSGYIHESGFQSASKEGGRKPIGLVFNPKAGYGIGVDIGGTKILMIATDMDGNEVSRLQTPTVKNPSEIISEIDKFIEFLPFSRERILTMGIGIPGIVNLKDRSVIESPALGWSHVSFDSFIHKNWDFPVFVNNDVRCGAYGEKWLGNARMVNDYFFVAFGTGVGSAIVLNRQLVNGFQYSAGEVGYLLTLRDLEEGHINEKGKFGVFEQKTSGSYLSSHGMNGLELFSNYQLNDSKAVQIIDQFLEEVSLFFANISSLLNPEKIIIAGGVSHSLIPFLHRINQRVSELTPIPVTIQSSLLGGDACSFGAIAYAFESLENY